MSNIRRKLVEVFAPPFLATIALVILIAKNDSASGILLGFIPFLFCAYVFGIIPSLLYMLAMESWFKLKLRGRWGMLCTVGLSVLLGTAAGLMTNVLAHVTGFLTGADDLWLPKIGALVGLLVGFYGGRQQPYSA